MAQEAAARFVGTLFMSRRITIDEHALGLEIREFLVTVIAQEQRLASIADEYDRVVRNLDFAHEPSNLQLIRLNRTTPDSALILVKLDRAGCEEIDGTRRKASAVHSSCAIARRDQETSVAVGAGCGAASPELTGRMAGKS